jgi:hypothetical protein
MLIIIVIFGSYSLDPSSLNFSLIYRFQAVKLRLTDLMLESGKCSRRRIHSEIVTRCEYLVVAGCLLIDFLVQEVHGALH